MSDPGQPDAIGGILKDTASTINEAMREYIRASIQQKDIVNYNGANLAFNHAADTANKLGLSEDQKLGIAPFPGHPPSNTTTIEVNPKPEPQMEPQPQRPAQPKRTLASALVPFLALSGVGATAGIGSSLVTSYFLSNPGPPPQKAPADPGKGSVGLEVEEL